MIQFVSKHNPLFKTYPFIHDRQFPLSGLYVLHNIDTFTQTPFFGKYPVLHVPQILFLIKAQLGIDILHVPIELTEYP